MYFWCEWIKCWTLVHWQEFLAFLSFSASATLPHTITATISVTALQKSLSLYFTQHLLLVLHISTLLTPICPDCTEPLESCTKPTDFRLYALWLNWEAKLVSSSSALSGAVKQHSDTRDSLKPCAARSCRLFQSLRSNASNGIMVARNRMWHGEIQLRKGFGISGVSFSVRRFQLKIRFLQILPVGLKWNSKTPRDLRYHKAKQNTIWNLLQRFGDCSENTHRELLENSHSLTKLLARDRKADSKSVQVSGKVTSRLNEGA